MSVFSSGPHGTMGVGAVGAPRIAPTGPLAKDTVAPALSPLGEATVAFRFLVQNVPPARGQPLMWTYTAAPSQEDLLRAATAVVVRGTKPDFYGAVDNAFVHAAIIYLTRIAEADAAEPSLWAHAAVANAVVRHVRQRWIPAIALLPLIVAHAPPGVQQDVHSNAIQALSPLTDDDPLIPSDVREAAVAALAAIEARAAG